MRCRGALIKYVLILVFSIFNQITGISQNNKKTLNQDFEIRGVLKDSLSQSGLEAATVFLESVKDSTLITYTITDKDGIFNLEGRSPIKDARVNISFVGYKTYSKEVDLSKSPIVLEDITLGYAVASLDEVFIQTRAPVTVKKDTLEFNVSSFKTKKDATIEDLLKELPGVEVDEDGTIRVNGKEVNKILVNGKPFFGDDPTITTRNLTKEIIEKIQVTDTKTDDEAFAGEEGDKENKTINLTIKEENNKGVFGRLAAGGGTDSRFEYAGIVNIFDNDRRISFLGGGNNLNNPGFTFGEIRDNFRNNLSTVFGFGGGASGIVNSRNAGANYADELTKGFDLSANYFYSGSNNFNENTTERENIFPDQRFFTNSNSRTDGNRDDHSVSLEAKIAVDSTFLITVRPRFQINDSENRFSSSEVSLDDTGSLINSSTSQSLSDTSTRNFGNTLNLTKRFGEGGSFLKFNLSNTINRSESEDLLNTETIINQGNQDDIFRDQLTDGETTRNAFTTRLTYRHPLISKKLFLDIELEHQDNQDENRRSTFEFDENSQAFTSFNDVLSTDFSFTNRRTTPSLELSFNNDTWSAGVETGYVFRNLENEDQLRPELSIDRDFEAIEIDSYLSYKIDTQKSIYLSYDLNNRPPRVDQLSPFEDVRDPLNTLQGNPDLEPTNTHSIYLSYNGYNFQKKSGIYLFGNLDIDNNAVVSRTSIDENLVRSTTYENVNGNYRLNLNGFYNKSVKLDSLRTLKYNLGFNGGITRAINFNDDIQYASLVSNINPRAGIGLEWKNAFNLRLNYNPTLSRTTFDLDIFQDQSFIRHNASFTNTVNAIKKWEWVNTVNFNFNPDVADGFQRTAFFWNSSLSYSFLKDNAKITLKVFDLLNQNTNARRTATANFIQDVRSTVLQQYFLLNLSWKFNSLGSKGKTNNDGILYFD